MAIFVPTIDYIKNHIKPSATTGEMWLLKQLQQLDDSYEVYFQPFLNGDYPDIIILKKNCGAYIIEVKDYNFKYYSYDPISRKSKYGALRVINKGNIPIMTPMEQVMRYKNNLFGLHCEEISERNLESKSLYSSIKTGVFFYCEDEVSVSNTFRQYQNKYINLWGNNSCIVECIERELAYEKQLFSEKIYQEIKNLLSPSFHRMDQNMPPTLTKRQEELAKSVPGQQMKIKGVAGSGKTIVLAKRAINAYNRMHEPVLILTFNITMRNYIIDKISQFRSEISKKNFYVIHFHEFIKQQITTYNIANEDEAAEINRLNTDEKINLLLTQLQTGISNAGINIKKFPTILIDEVQDFKYEWLAVIKQVFLDTNGEYVLFGDEKQNIYARELDNEQKTKTNVKGRWTQLNECFRLSSNIADLANKFQRYYLCTKYEIEDIQGIQQTLFDKQDIEYHETYGENNEITWEIIEKYIVENNIHRNDLCILSPKVENLRELEWYIRTKKNISVKRVFETKEQYETACKSTDVESAIYRIRRSKKFNFWMNSGEIKMSTIHSFKGWEAYTLVILLSEDNGSENAELIYTALTRCRKNLIIINTQPNGYQKFFNQAVGKKYQHPIRVAMTVAKSNVLNLKEWELPF